MGETKPHVEELQCHLPDQQSIVIHAAILTTEGLEGNAKARMTTLTEYFALNEVAVQYAQRAEPSPFFFTRRGQTTRKDPRDYLYTEIPEHFTWVKADRRWKIREKQSAIGRMYFINPKAGDLYLPSGRAPKKWPVFNPSKKNQSINHSTTYLHPDGHYTQLYTSSAIPSSWRTARQSSSRYSYQESTRRRRPPCSQIEKSIRI